MWSNFHTHSNFCDGKGDVDDYYTSATTNLIGLGFSSHAPLPFKCGWCMSADKLPEYLASIDQLKTNSGLQVYKGLEIDFIPGVISPNDYREQLDYTIGSIHFVDAFSDGQPWEIDGPYTSFLLGLNSIFQGRMRPAVTRYLELTREMVEVACPMVIGHMDKIKIQNQGDSQFSESETWYQDEIKRTLGVIHEAGCIVEVNTRGIYKKKSSTTYPSPWILQLIFQNEIPITLNSDAHHPTELIEEFSTVAELLSQIGFKKMSTFVNGNWEQVPFNRKGLIVE